MVEIFPYLTLTGDDRHETDAASQNPEGRAIDWRTNRGIKRTGTIARRLRYGDGSRHDGWLWGPAGLILGALILLVDKAVCDRVDALKPIGELLGD